MSFADLTKGDVGKVITVLARVEDIRQTAGPTLFALFDGTGNLSAKAFLKPGKRAYPEMGKCDIVQAVLQLREYEGAIEAEIVSIEKRESAAFEQQLAAARAEKIKVGHVPFLAKSEWLEKMRPLFERAALLIRQAIYDKRPILVRHNADCDGYSGAIALERAIVPLVLDYHKDDYSQWRYYRRAPSKAPFYAYGDAVLDLVTAVGDMVRHGLQAPLIVIVDNGSGKEDLLSIQKVKVYGCPVVVVDHHFVGDDVISPVVDVQVNPYLVGYNHSICSGMLGTELARFVNPAVAGVNFLPALSGMGDKIKGKEMEQYVAIAGADGYDAPYLKHIALCVDFEAHYLRFVEGRGLVDDLLGADKEKQKRMVGLLYPEVRGRMDRILDAVKHYIDVREVGGKVVAFIDMDNIATLGEFPAFGKITGMTSDWLNEKYKKGVYVLGVSSEMIVMRVSESEVRFNVNYLVAELQRQKPHALVSGGGHERAGTLKFVGAAHDEVVAFVKGYIERV